MRLMLFSLCFLIVVLFSSSGQNLPQGLLANLLSIVFVFGGTLIATMISFPVEKIRQLRHTLQSSFTRTVFDYAGCAHSVLHIARAYKKRGFKHLEQAADHSPSPYMALGLRLIADNASFEQIESAIEKEFIFDRLQTDAAERILRAMARYAPAFGLAGTIVGLMRIFPQLTNPGNIGAPMSLALLTTLYGVLSANLVFLPIANKLRDCAADDEVMLRFVFESLQCIQERQYAVVIEQRLCALMPRYEAEKYQTVRNDELQHLHLADSNCAEQHS